MQYLTKLNTKKDTYSVPTQGVKYLGEARELIKETVKHKIVDVFGSENKA